MPAPKHPSVRARARDANRRGGLRVLPGGSTREAPPWPLPPDTERVAALEALRDVIARAQLELEATEDGRAKGRIARKLERDQLKAAQLALELDQAGDREQARWAELWSFPQAALWHENKSHHAVATYVRFQLRAEQGDIKAAIEARQWTDRLGLNDLSLLRLRAEVERVDEAEQRGERRRTPASAAAVRDKPKPDPRYLLGL